MQGASLPCFGFDMLRQGNGMIKIHLRPRSINGDERSRCYRVAQQDLAVDLALDVLSGFEQTCPDRVKGAMAGAPVSRMDEAQLLYQGPGWIGNEWREVVCWSVPSGYQLSVAGIGRFWISEAGDAIACVEEETTADFDNVVQTVLGPALIVALAKRDVWSFHGSAVAVADRAILFLGESRKGKSTLGHWLDRQEGNAWRRIGDDIMPVSQSKDGLDALPYFPQLKLPQESQPCFGLPERLPIDAIYVLGRPADGEAVKVRSLGTQEGTLSLVRHTVASRLFDAELLEKHLDFCVSAAANIPVRQLVYPLTRAALPQVQAALMTDLSLQPGSAWRLTVNSQQ
jgi:hypothetical protein